MPPHDFKNFPELTNSQMQVYYFESPHKQITEDFTATVVKVTDGDTVRVEWKDRDFTFPIRLSNLAAPELDEGGGEESQSWLEAQVLGKEVDVLLSKQRVEKWGRLLADIMIAGASMSELSQITGHGVAWADRKKGAIPDFSKELEKAAI